MAKEELKTLDEKIVEILKAPDGYGTLFINILDVKKFMGEVEEIITRRCKGTSANCFEIKKEIREGLGEKLTPLETEAKKNER